MSTTMIVKPGPVLNFLMDNQNVKTPYQIDWIKVVVVSFIVLIHSCDIFHDLNWILS